MQIAVGASLQHHPSKNPLCIPSSNICKATSLLPLLLVCIGIIIALGYPGGPDPLLLLLKPSIQRMVVSLCGGGWWYMHSISAFCWGLGRFASCSRSPLSTRSTRILLFIIEQRRSFQIEWVGFTNLEFIASLGGAEVIVAMIEQIPHRQGICSLRSAAAATAIR